MCPNSLTVRDRVLEQLRRTPWRSSTEVANLIGSSYGTVSSLCAKLVRQKVLIRREGYGPHGGWGYAFPDQQHFFREGNNVFSTASYPTIWEHILDE